ncbi:MAG: hypothetical protein CMO01_04510 [Thalassobius sp.]|nr:hypothetical protein [Thalassovita sp.]
MNEIKLFEDKEIRSVLVEGEWYYAVADVVGVLSESKNPRNYWNVLKKREKQLVTNCKQLKMPAPNGRMYKIDCANKEGLLRIIQSIPSKKAEPFKLWLAGVGSQYLDEKTNKRLIARKKLKESQERLFDNVKDRGIDGEAFKRLVKNGDISLFGGEDMNKKYGIEEDDNIDDYMNTLLLMGKGFASEITHHNVLHNDVDGEKNINEEHQNSNKAIRGTLIKETKVKPEDLPPEKDLKKIQKGKNKKSLE